jgi:uncharacterized protein YeaO (DUF488 family)
VSVKEGGRIGSTYLCRALAVQARIMTVRVLAIRCGGGVKLRLAMPIRTKRWDDPRERDDGYRLLITRYRPRALPKADETWDAWQSDLAPSAELHAAFYGKGRPPIGWQLYRLRYLREMKGQTPAITELAERVANGETITLLCSSACIHESRCHRSLLKTLIEEHMAGLCS